MLKKGYKLNQIIDNLQNQVEYDLKPYKKVLDEINSINFSNLSDHELKNISLELKTQAIKGVCLDSLLPKSFALAREASRRVLGMYPFDMQVIAGIAMHMGKIAEMQTGEGKTLAAVMPAYLNALTGKGVHILTFNDYLANRDTQWMGPIYSFLGLTVSHISEGLSEEKRRKAYGCDITYVTAKEAGFDYLRDFLCSNKELLVHRPFNYAIVDEADSILIDEARIPLVIAGNVPEEDKSLISLSKLVKDLRLNEDYELDQYDRNVSLTDTGLSNVEELLKCDNLYDSENLDLLTRLNCAMHAEFLLKRDRDYIVRNNKIDIIDEFTGRIADKRHWPDNLQGAVEAKEGLKSESKGVIMGSIALQYFLSLYEKLSGMTGTAHMSAEEFSEFYLIDVVIIPTNKPCIRKDHPDMIFTHKEAKEKALIAEIKKIHETGQPILVGTSSVEESEWLASELRKINIKCEVLNAKNDEMEAEIIARAGELGAITVSTNMAGRGVDIKLGGVYEQERSQVVSTGGLYVIGTNRHESLRIDNQLRGRAGRQGDPGESIFFVSLEDQLVKRFDITKLMSDKFHTHKQVDPINDSTVRYAIERAQRIAQGYNFDIRKQLWKYTFIVEHQRRILHKKRQDILLDKITPEVLLTHCPDHYHLICNKVGENAVREAEKQITLYHINKCWTDYLDYIAYVREGIHLVAIGKKNPIDEFHKIVIEAFDKMLQKIDDETINTFKTIEIKEDGIDIDKAGIKGPSATWTYLVNDSPEQFDNVAIIAKAADTVIKGTLFTFKSIFKHIFKNRQHKNR